MKLCTIEGCEQTHKARGLCRLHYQRQAATGRTDLASRPSTNELFWSKVEKTDGCWNWTAATDANGYGRFSRKAFAHRFAFALENGHIPQGAVLDHMCHNPGCVRPDHLRACTQKQNLENQSGAYSTSKSGVRGVSWNANAKKWVGFVQHNKKNIYVGYFDTIEEAEAAVIALRNKLFTHNDADRRAA